MKPKIVSEKVKKVTYRTLTLRVDKFTVIEGYTDDVLASQRWSVKGGFKTTHPSAYSPHNMHFAYYDNIDFLNSDTCSNTKEFDNEIPQPSFITDWDKFKGLDHVLCVYISMDGNIYKINESEPVTLWRYKDYIGSFSNDRHNLEEIKAALDNMDWIRNAKIINIPYYNCEEDRNKAIEFEYRSTSSKVLTKLFGFI